MSFQFLLKTPLQFYKSRSLSQDLLLKFPLLPGGYSTFQHIPLLYRSHTEICLNVTLIASVNGSQENGTKPFFSSIINGNLPVLWCKIARIVHLTPEPETLCIPTNTQKSHGVGYQDTLHYWNKINRFIIHPIPWPQGEKADCHSDIYQISF